VIPTRRLFPLLLSLCISVFTAGTLAAQKADEPFTPVPGQAGKDVVWVPTPDELVDKMLDMAAITPQDFVMDLGSGDGRMVIAVAKRGVPALGVEYNEKMVALSRQRAKEAGVSDLARFEQGDMYAADISKASVMALFLLSENLDKLAPKFLAMKPGSRIVLNHFLVSGWKPDRSERIQPCEVWCTAHLYIVPAKVEGEWRIGDATLSLKQNFQMFDGTLTRDGKPIQIADGRLNGDRISFTAGGTKYEGRVDGDRIAGDMGADGKNWSASRVRSAN
jgi:hypothetical protein